MAADPRVSAAMADTFSQALVDGALPGETEGFTPDEQADAAAFIAEAAAERRPGEIALKLQSVGGESARRLMRLVIVNDDMPFLVDSVAAVIAGHGLTVRRLLHPIVSATRDGERLVALGKGNPESIIYVELDRADARGRHELVQEIEAVLASVRAAVGDWQAMLATMREDALQIARSDAESGALLDWLASNNFTLLGHKLIAADGSVGEGRGILSADGIDLWSSEDLRGLVDALRDDHRRVLLLKADRLSPVHRRVPLDVVVVRRDDGSLSLHAGLWTSAALRSSPAEIPVVRGRLAELDRELGFAPASHGAKALAHAMSTLPPDLLISFGEREVRAAALTAMSLADRPRPALLLLPGALHRHLFAFVWLPRDELSTTRRLAIQKMIEEAVLSSVTSWAVELGDGDLALIRLTLGFAASRPLPDVAKLDEHLVDMVRGWAPAVEAELGERVGSGRAIRLALTYLPGVPEDYRSRATAEEAASDILRLCALEGADDRDVRLYREASDRPGQLRLKLYRSGGLVPLSEAVPVFENFGFRVIEERPTALGEDSRLGHIHDFRLELAGADPDDLLARTDVIEGAIGAVLQRHAEDDEFNQLVLFAGLDPQPVVWLRAWFRYLRQTGVAYGLVTMVDALKRTPAATRALVSWFTAAHDPSREGRKAAVEAERAAFEAALNGVKSIDDDRILRLFRSVVEATLRTNAFSPQPDEALAFKLDPTRIPGLPAPIPYREIWVYSPRVEGIHLRGGPVARGGLRWSDRRDDFRTEILGLMKAQLVKNAVIVPTGAKGGFYPKHLPSPATDREAWLAEGTESYRIFIRSLLSVTDNIVEGKVVHPDGVVVHDGDDPYFVVAADKGTATFSDVANAIALERGFWLGDAFASGGSNGYDHKAMGITAKGAWISVQRHFLEMGIDIQSEPVTVAGCGDMSGDVFGNGMLLSKAIQLVAAFDHRHIFIDPTPDPATSWEERNRLFALPRSSWDDYDRSRLSPGAMIVPRSQKEIVLTPEAAAAIGVAPGAFDPAGLISAILKAPVGLMWFGGIGTYVKSRAQANSAVGDPANDALRVDAADLRAKVLGEGANLAITQAARIEFSELGGRCNTDFIDNSAGVDCSDNEVNIKIPLNQEMLEGRLTLEARNELLARMTDEVGELVLDDNRRQTLALSVAERSGAAGLPVQVRTLELLEAAGRLDRRVEGLESSDELLRRVGDNRGLTRPELSVLLSLAKLSLQDAAEELRLAEEPMMQEQLLAAFPAPLREAHREALLRHRLGNEIIATKVANRFVNRLGPSVALDLTEEEGSSLAQVVAAFLTAERLLKLDLLWQRIEDAPVSEAVRLDLFAMAAQSVRSHMSDILRAAGGETSVSELVALLEPGLNKIDVAARSIIRDEVKAQAVALHGSLEALGAGDAIVRGLVKLYELDGVFGIAALSERKEIDALELTHAYVRIGEALGIDWAQSQALRLQPVDQWERLLVAGLLKEFEQLRIDWLSRTRGDDPVQAVERWAERQEKRIEQFRRLVTRARGGGAVSVPMLAQIASQARILLSR
ncbi:glutamate dehydrogenase [Sphingomonas kaistensis]|uniref:Glutamate dehydrogenase n=1 Tax=Sphingomonas kaistensis TaxID=298708 RepID=A0A7X6BGG6_9SPHN|nr:NAD-glutamate dehydrogenase domain-containing protein [Sphingomonas kaistensis]NJC05046.1 glutamate dehydrogenase [Sphingomonas kaistensis]